MINQATTIVLIQYASQAFLALIVMLLLNKFYRNYQNKYFQYWSWSWLGLMIYFVGSAIAMASLFYLGINHPIRSVASFITVGAGLFQAMWLLIGSYELSQQKELSKRGVLILSLLIIPISLFLVMAYMNDPAGGIYRIFFRVGVKSLVSGISFIVSAILVLRLSRSGVGMKFILIAFLLYGIEQFNYFLSFLAPVLEFEHFFETPYYLGVVDFLLQAVMGIGMIVSVLELEQIQLKKANSELDTFLYRSSHDLRAPLTTIMGLVSAIKSGKEPKKDDEFVDLIENRVNQADKVIKDIITLRKGQKMGLDASPVKLNERIKEIFEKLSSPIDNRIQLKVNTEEIEILTDAEKLDTILSNIISNAIKYHDLEKNNPFIEVSISRDEFDRICIAVRDNGLGINEKYLPKIFDMFYRANQNSKGSGLGLYLAKDALEHLDGEIEVESKEGIGTTFVIKLRNMSLDLSIN